MTEDKRKQYEEAARDYANKEYGNNEFDSIPEVAYIWKDGYDTFLAGCSHAHSKIEEAERAILSDVFTVIENHQTLSMDDGEYKALENVKEELKKLRK